MIHCGVNNIQIHDVVACRIAIFVTAIVQVICYCHKKGVVGLLLGCGTISLANCCYFGLQLMNQADGAGPPPAQKDQIDALPSVIVVQEQVGELPETDHFGHFEIKFNSERIQNVTRIVKHWINTCLFCRVPQTHYVD